MSGREQYFVELVNRARLDPLGELQRTGVTHLNENLAAGTISSGMKQPLAPDSLLYAAALGHSQWMIETNTFSHTGKDGTAPSDRIQQAGYALDPPWSTGENIAWSGTTSPTSDLEAASVIDGHHVGLFQSSGHRVNILGESFREIGIAQDFGTFTHDGIDYRTSMATQNFALSGDTGYVTGVVFQDTDGDSFYDLGEGLSGQSVSFDGQTVSTAAGGGFVFEVSANTTASLSLESTQQDLAYGGTNRKVDFSIDSEGVIRTYVRDDGDYFTVDGVGRITSTPVVDGAEGDLYRFYNTKAGGHFFTASEEERDIVVDYADFQYEGIGFRTHEAQVEGAVPVYRFYNTQAGGHFFTTDQAEKAVVDEMPQFRAEGIGFWAYGAAADGRQEVHRFYNKEAGGHFFTTDEAERDQVMTMANYDYEGIGFYALA